MPEASLRERCPYTIPKTLANLRSLDIVRCDDLGPVTKLVPALDDFPPDQDILIVDDDTLYPPTMIEDFVKARIKFPVQALSSSGWRIPPDLTDRPDTLWSKLRERPPAVILGTRHKIPVPVDILRGCDGYLVRPGFFNVGTIQDFSSAPPAARWVDDVWISAECSAEKIVIPTRRMPFFFLSDWIFFERSSLHRTNNSVHPDLRANTILIRFFASRWVGSR